MTIKELERLYDYGYWANRKLFAVVSQLTHEEFTRTVSGSYGSVRNTLVHMMSAEWGWLDRCGGAARGPALKSEDCPTFESIQPQWLLCWALALATAVSAAAQQPPVQSDQDVLIALEQRWNKAFYEKDLAFIESVLADDFIATYDDGSRGDRRKELALAAAFNQQVESAVPSDFTVRVYRDTAVVWFTLNLVGLRDGKREPLTLRYTDVWVNRDGRWQCVSTHSTRVSNR
jgi:uncharacterized damage-inducible protein DinB